MSTTRASWLREGSQHQASLLTSTFFSLREIGADVLPQGVDRKGETRGGIVGSIEPQPAFAARCPRSAILHCVRRLHYIIDAGCLGFAIALGSCGPDPAVESPQPASDGGGDDVGDEACSADPPINKGCPPNCDDSPLAEAGACGTSCPRIFADAVRPTAVAADETGVVWTEGATNGGCARTSDGDGGLRCLGGGNGIYLALDQDDLVWGWNDLFLCARAGCADPLTPTMLTTPTQSVVTRIGAVTLGPGAVYYSDLENDRIVSCPRTGCGTATAQVATPRAIALAVLADDLFWISSDDSIRTCKTADCPATERALLSNLTSPSRLVVDVTGVYFSELNTGPRCARSSQGRLTHLQKDGTRTVLYERNTSDVTLDDEFVYFIAEGWIMKCPKSGCGDSPIRIANSVRTRARRIAVDGAHVYWTEESGNAVVIADK
jgi:hypothetical protein